MMRNRKKITMRLREERGISAVIAVVSLVGILGAALLSLDFGSMWSSRRQIITATDSTVLRQASLAALNKPACNTDPGAGEVYLDYLFKNANTLVPNSWSCVLHEDPNNPGTGYVVVDARKYADTRFGGLFGFVGDTQPYSLSAAQYGFTNPIGLRPMSFCIQNPHVMQWIWYQNWLKVQGGETADPNFGQLNETTYNSQKGILDAGRPPVVHFPAQTGDSLAFIPPADGRIDFPQGDAANGVGGASYASFGVVHRMFFTKEDVNEQNNCGSDAPGNWGWIGLDGGQPSTAKQNDWVLNGYDGEVGANDCNADGTPGDGCPGDTGSSGGSGQQELRKLVDAEAVFHIPIFTDIVCPCSGSNATFKIWGFLPLILRGFQNTGAQDSRYFDFEFKDVISSGPCCNATGNVGGPKTVKICGVDHDGTTSDAVIAARCGQGT